MIKSAMEMVEAAKAEIENLNTAEAHRRVTEEGALFVDIRDVRELQKLGVVPGAHHAPRGMLEFWVASDSPYHQKIFTEDREFIFCCGAGWRSALATKQLQDMGLPRVSHVETGFTGWAEDGLPVISYEEWKAARKAARGSAD